MIAGSPRTVAEALERTAQRYETDEVLVVTVTHDYEARLESYRLLAGELGLEPRRPEDRPAAV